ncbi:hypothetical protein SDC9_74803 [bioreactor metagenome]|uniref:Uncharacterized protein n=1 Tax=bioreactor metagenome TaxID=1076179 RepID=A0A644YP54_9ZZZZ
MVFAQKHVAKNDRGVCKRDDIRILFVLDCQDKGFIIGNGVVEIPQKVIMPSHQWYGLRFDIYVAELL